MGAKKRYQAWLQDPLIDSASKAELRQLAGNCAEIEDRFFRWLEFGTGGLRGKMGAGSNRVNVYTIRLVTQALANVIQAKGFAQKGVVIAYDSRKLSLEFAKEAAAVLVGNGIPVFVFRELAPTPLLSFAVRQKQAAAGIMITASHNPAQYNGYKAYDHDGKQLLPQDAAGISAQMAKLGLGDVAQAAAFKASPLWHWLGEEIIQVYLQQLLEIAKSPMAKKPLRVLYTALHGTGARFLPEILKKAGFSQVAVVAEQMIPDGSFPTVPSPNPEDAASFGLSLGYARQEHYDLILATDPDADRLGVAANQHGEWVFFNGHQIGVLLLDYILEKTPRARLKNAVVIKTIVTSEMVLPIAAQYGVEVQNTLTGFKYIGALMDSLEAQKKKFLFGFEESYGYLAGTAVRDKDAILAGLLVAEAAAYWQEKGLSLPDRLDWLLQTYGYYLQALHTYSFASSWEAEKAQGLLCQFRQAPFLKIGSESVAAVLDYNRGQRLDLKHDQRSPINLPRENVWQWFTDKDSKITLRPSGTEPKMKLYVEVVDKEEKKARQRLQRLIEAFDEIVRAGLSQ